MMALAEAAAPEAEALLVAGARDADAPVREAAAVRAPDEHGGEAPSLALVAALGDASPIRRATAEILAGRKDPRMGAALIAQVEAADPFVRPPRCGRCATWCYRTSARGR